MELQNLIDRFVQGLEYVDANTSFSTANARTGEIYLPGVKTLTERQFIKELVDWWKENNRSDFDPLGSIETEVPYVGIERAKCDLVLTTDGNSQNSPEWAIEVKHIALVGNNGKNNDYGVAKILSPYLKDRSLIHDINRMRKFGVARRRAVIGYCFSYDSETCKEAKKRHPEKSLYIENIEKVLKLNDPERLEYSILPMIDFAHKIFTELNLVYDLKIKPFNHAWRHPCGGRGVVFGWELKHLKS